jgi:methylenetetrahydrofolate dehydrogenase (NADP+) / methenyltetrahydrofolate cyclohydrolase
MKLRSKHLVADIRERQVRELAEHLQGGGVRPRLAIVVTVDHAAIDVYMRKKKEYGNSLGIDVDIHRVSQSDVPELLKRLNKDAAVQGIIIQLPLADPSQTEELTSLVAPEKDVDGLGPAPRFEPATPLAILWLLEGHGIDLKGKNVVLVGRGKLVGRPLFRMLAERGIKANVIHSQTQDARAEMLEGDVVITATGRPGIIKADMVKPGTVLVDAGTAGEGGKTVGDVSPEVYERDDLSVTPKRGGVGPLTVCALFENVIRASRLQVAV